MIYRAEDFTWDNSEKYDLIIDASTRIAPKVVIYDADHKELMYLAKHTDFLSEWENLASAAPQRTFKATSILVPQVDVLWYPKEVFEPSQASVYGNWLTDDGVSVAISEEIKSLDLISLYRNDLSNLEQWQTLFPKARQIAASNLLIQGMGAYLKDDENLSLGLHFGGGNCMVYLFKIGEFQYFNEFKYNSTLDVGFQLQELSETFKLDSSSVRVLLSGNVQKGEPNFTAVLPFFRDPELVDLTEVTGDARVPGSLTGGQHEFLLFYLLMHKD